MKTGSLLRSREAGIGLVELVVIAPLFLLLVGGSVELAAYIRDRSRVTDFAREVAVMAFRSCIYLTEQDISGMNQGQIDYQLDLVNACLRDVAASASAAGQEQLPGLQIVIRAVKLDPYHPPRPAVRAFGQAALPVSALGLSRVFPPVPPPDEPVQQFLPPGERYNLLTYYDCLIYAEVFHRHQVVVRYLDWAFALAQRDLYGVFGL